MRTINVLLPEFREPTFKTAEEAIADGDRRSRSALALKVRGTKSPTFDGTPLNFSRSSMGNPADFESAVRKTFSRRS
jgi:hypothetical protein